MKLRGIMICETLNCYNPKISWKLKKKTDPVVTFVSTILIILIVITNSSKKKHTTIKQGGRGGDTFTKMKQTRFLSVFSLETKNKSQ